VVEGTNVFLSKPVLSMLKHLNKLTSNLIQNGWDDIIEIHDFFMGRSNLLGIKEI